MKTLSKLLVIISLVIICTACPHQHYWVRFANNSEEIIYVYEEYNARTYFPDTILNLNPRFIQPISANADYGLACEYRYGISDTIYWFILQKDSGNNYTVLQQYNVSEKLTELKDLNFTLYYPPTKAMKHIKMYPPYKEE